MINHNFIFIIIIIILLTLVFSKNINLEYFTRPSKQAVCTDISYINYINPINLTKDQQSNPSACIKHKIQNQNMPPILLV